MKLQRESINLGSDTRGKWLFYIYDKNEDLLEKVEETLCKIETPFSLGGEQKTWGDYCDNCPNYDDGCSSGFWIAVEDVEDFKSAWKIAKKVK